MNTLRRYLFTLIVALVFFTNSQASVGVGYSEVGTLSSLTGSNSINIGSLVVTGDNVSTISGGVYSVSGNAMVNNFLKFDGDIIVDQNQLSIEGNCLVYIEDIPFKGIVQLYNGEFSFSVVDDLLMGALLSSANNLLSLGNMPVHLDNIQLLADGIRIDGELIFPEVMGNFGANLSTLQITSSAGIQLVGGIHINEIGFHGILLQDLSLNFDTINDIFSGEGSLKTQHFKITADAEIIQGALNSIGVWVELGHPIAVGATGLSISGGGGSVRNIVNPPMVLGLGISLVPTVQGSFKVVELSELNLEYEFGRRFTGSGNLLVFAQDMASAEINITKNSVGIGGSIDIAGVLDGSADASISKSPNGVLIFEGNMEASVNIPAGEDFPLDLVSAILDLPITLVETDFHIKNKHIWGNVKISWLLSVGIDVEFLDPGIDVHWGKNFSSLNNKIFNKKYLMNNNYLQSINRFEGKSLILSPNNKDENFRIKGNNLLQTFEIQDVQPLIIVRLEGENSTPTYSIKLPNGQIVNQSNVNNFSNIEYREKTSLNKGFYVIKNPQLGEYEVEILNFGNYYLDVIGSNSPPNMVINSIQSTGSSLEIDWFDADVDDNAIINLYYDSDNTGNNGVMIAEGIMEDDEQDHYSYNLDSMATGTFYIYGVIQDSTNTPVSTYYQTPFSIVNTSAPLPPQNLESTLTDTSIVLNWNKSASEVENYNLYYTTNQDLSLNSQSYSLGDTSNFVFSNFVPGNEYKFAVSAVDSNYFESELSNIITVTYISATLNNAPVILEQEFPSLVNVNELLSYQIETFDADGDNLLFTIQEAPSNLTISSSGLLEWTPTQTQIGVHNISFKVDDQNGLQDSTSFFLKLIDSLSSQGSLNFNQALYQSYEDAPVITLNDINLNVSPTKVDSQIVNIVSTRDPSGIEVYAKETNTNSGIFRSTINLTENVGDNVSLSVYGTDTLTAIYLDEYPSRLIETLSYFIDSTGIASINVDSSWNLVSIPLLINDMSFGSLFPDAVSSAFSFGQTGYTQKDTAVLGKGYWLKFNSDESYSYNGSRIIEPVQVDSGWNIIGPFYETINTDQISSTPANIVSSNYFGYSSAYTISQTLQPGKAYWVKVNQDGQLDLSSSGKKGNKILNDVFDGKIIISDQNDKKAELFISEKVELSKYEMPPSPPESIFDVRFTSNQMVEDLSEGNKSIIIKGAAYPLSIKSEGMSVKIQDMINGNFVNKVVEDGKEIFVYDNSLNVFSIELLDNTSKQVSFNLEQNYPNPFNPSTTIHYSLPEASHVRLLIYNSIGEVVRELVNQEKESGNHLVEWNGKNSKGNRVSSGIYFYRFEAKASSKVIVDTKKMILLK